MVKHTEQLPQRTRVEVIEYERHWGPKLDRELFFDSYEEAEEYVKEFNSVNNKERVPDWYMAAHIVY